MKTALFCASIWTLALVAPAYGASWNECNDAPVRPKYPPMGLYWDACSMPPGSAQERALLSGLYETRHYVLALGFGSSYVDRRNGVCVIDHDNDRSEVALVSRADLDGRPGLTRKYTDGCNFSWEEERILTADVMVAADLDFARADESRLFNNVPPGSRIGALVMLHELTHALGLEHSTAFATMRNGGVAGVPFIGMSPGSGGLGAGLTGDDVFGISRIYGFTPSYRNTFVSSQTLRAGSLMNNDINPANNDTRYPDPLLVCPGNQVAFLATVGNVSTRREELELTVYADADLDAYYFSPSDALAFYGLALDGRGTSSFRVDFTIPASLPANVTQHIYVSTRNTSMGERKGYDDSARSALRIRRAPGC